ncbi:MAG TPA: HNH endonuclease signature motif containing protein [Vicinamibacterales bacterium]|nr:HNH endonuclease signature motif containing protein [Vicinamibacterales bacterium]
MNDGIHFSNSDLIARIKDAALNERGATARLIALLAEFDERRLYLGEGCSSLFTYCTRVLKLSEHAAYGRIAAARASKRWPAILELLATGDINLTTVVLLGPHLAEENHEALLEAARGKSKGEIERLIAALQPQPDIPSSVRRVPEPTATRTMDFALPSARSVVAPLAPERYLIKVTVSAGVHANLKRAQDLLRHTIPTGEPAAIVERALAVLVEQLERTKHARAERPRPRAGNGSVSARRVPAAVRRSVWQRDGGRCAFVGAEGRCTETGCLEFHHLRPFADLGPTTIENLSLRCRAHNLHESRVWSGETNSV